MKKDFGKIDIMVHSLANGPEVTKPLLETSRNGYLAASSASAYRCVTHDVCKQMHGWMRWAPTERKEDPRLSGCTNHITLSRVRDSTPTRRTASSP